MRTVTLRREQMFSGPLILVNQQHPIHPQYQPELTPVDDAHLDILLERQTARLLSTCIHAIGGREAIVPVSGWRSQAEQQQIWDDTMVSDGPEFTRQFVAVPGCSEHQSGLAIDLGRAADHIDFIRPDFPYDGICGTFRRRALQYGFVERYGGDKEAVTGIAHEPWHFRYVGVPHARLMADRHLCLEEYTSLLRDGPLACTLDNGRSVRVFHVPCAGEETAVPLPNACCQISGNNVDGFVITVWEDLA